MSDLPWHVAHVRPRCEKKLAEWCGREGLVWTLPLYRSVRKYRGKTVEFRKPLFPNYVFLRLSPQERMRVRQHQSVANLLDVPDQDEFATQLGGILTALESGVEVRLSPEIQPGRRVTIRTGPLRGLEAWVADRTGTCEVLLRLDFIGQAAAVRVSAEQLELA
jgi:transcription antitermination factor NusG